MRTGQNWYDRPKVRIPRVDLYVVYVGADGSPVDGSTINLTDEFFGGTACGIDVRARIICKPSGEDALSQYIRFSQISNRTIAEHGRTREAAEMIVNECITQGILPEFFEERKQEVLAAMVELFSQQEAYEMMESAKIREGELRGEARGKLKGKLDAFIDMLPIE